jgi:class 3 adenylate cyclase/tetratricopeptide (TPR) repeat protein
MIDNDKLPQSRHLPNVALAEIETLYNTRETSSLDHEPDACAAVARRALSLGEPLLAYDLCIFCLRNNPGHLALRQLQGLALARSGAQDQARDLLEKLYAEGHRDEETLGILARIYKDRWYESQNSSEGKNSLRRSQELYAQAYQLTGGYWTGINAATLASVLGRREISTKLATQVRSQCLVAEKNSSGPDVWRCATLGEAALLLGDTDGARPWYEKAIEAGAGHGDRASMRRNARIIVEAGDFSVRWLAQVLPPPVVAVFSGHMIDDDNPHAARFPERMTAAAGKAIKEHLESANVQIGYGAAASGEDILFHESILDLGRETHVVLPAPPEKFAMETVGNSQSNWLDRFQKVLDRAASVIVHSGSMSGEIGHAYNNWIILGLARLRAKQLGGRVNAFALRDGDFGQLGGTSSAVRDWQGFGQRIEWLPPMAGSVPAWQTVSGRPLEGGVARSIGSQRIISMLFADAVGFSKLSDDSIPAFVQHFLGTVARVLSRQDEPPLSRNTWGDGLYICFATPRAAGLFALELCEVVRKTDWTALGLPATLSLRIALHCGPAHEVFDPVTQQCSFSGAHVSRAARIEPITPPGSVYSSQAFAALCECEGVEDFFCEYVGRMPLAKKFGEYPTFSVRRLR